MGQGIAELIKALEAEELIAPSGAEGTSLADDPRATEPPSGDKQTYQPPVFERFTDMGDLLLLDPVHEAEEEKGWPHAKRNP